MICSVIGTRPQYVKAAPLRRALAGLDHYVIDTGQHPDYEMAEQVWMDCGLGAPDVVLGTGPRPPARLGQMVTEVAVQLRRLKPQLVLVYGDTDSTLAGALAARELGLPIVHLEAGARSFDYRQVEEQNRIMVDLLSAVNVTPTRLEADWLGPQANAQPLGDLLLDALVSVEDDLPAPVYASQVVLTLHRRENTDDEARLKAILDAVGFSGLTVTWPRHPRLRYYRAAPVTAVEPLPYRQLLAELRAAEVVVTDSGGVMREAAWLGKQVLVPRELYEWNALPGVRRAWAEALPQLLAEGVNTARHGGLPPAWAQASRSAHGDGRAAVAIAGFVRGMLGVSEPAGRTTA